MAYVAMFDEVDEGLPFSKVSIRRRRRRILSPTMACRPTGICVWLPKAQKFLVAKSPTAQSFPSHHYHIDRQPVCDPTNDKRPDSNRAIHGASVRRNTRSGPFDTTDDQLGTATAAGENNGINGNWEVAANAFDDSSAKWLDFANDNPAPVPVGYSISTPLAWRAW